jgi:hypothetical protein
MIISPFDGSCIPPPAEKAMAAEQRVADTHSTGFAFVHFMPLLLDLLSAILTELLAGQLL